MRPPAGFSYVTIMMSIERRRVGHCPQPTAPLNRGGEVSIHLKRVGEAEGLIRREGERGGIEKGGKGEREKGLIRRESERLKEVLSWRRRERGGGLRRRASKIEIRSAWGKIDPNPINPLQYSPSHQHLARTAMPLTHMHICTHRHVQHFVVVPPAGFSLTTLLIDFGRGAF